MGGSGVVRSEREPEAGRASCRWPGDPRPHTLGAGTAAARRAVAPAQGKRRGRGGTPAGPARRLQRPRAPPAQPGRASAPPPRARGTLAPGLPPPAAGRAATWGSRAGSVSRTPPCSKLPGAAATGQLLRARPMAAAADGKPEGPSRAAASAPRRLGLGVVRTGARTRSGLRLYSSELTHIYMLTSIYLDVDVCAFMC